jgi:catechol 2,3-dioxygenase-like lactoylglutathione lyase family enzyme
LKGAIAMENLESPFTGGVPAVFVHVSNLKKSVEWYSSLLGKEMPEKIRGDIHIFGLDNGANIFLVHTKTPKPSPQVLCSLPSPDLDKARAFFDKNQVEYEDVTEETVHFRDLDGNILMACSI